ncbi:MAG: hypothetical protein O9327_05875 [Polaromonas sp.]|nr:hypothetical protein [Polaromonas sp.]
MLKVHEVWGHEFMLDTCCEGVQEHANAFMCEEPKAAAAWLNELMASDGVFLPPLRRVIDGAGSLLLDYQLALAPVTFADVREFVARHHRHCVPPRGWRFGMGVVNGARGLTGGLVGLVSCGRPVARAIDQQRVVEVNRLCIDPDIPSGLVWNAASMLYGWAAREARNRGAEWIVTYTLASESGTTLRAAGWTPGHVTRGRAWSSPSRPRSTVTPTDDKVRWHRRLVKSPTYALPTDVASAERFLQDRI